MEFDSSGFMHKVLATSRTCFVILFLVLVHVNLVNCGHVLDRPNLYQHFVKNCWTNVCPQTLASKRGVIT